MNKKKLFALALMGTALLGCVAPGACFEFTAPVVDAANVVSPEVENVVNADLQAFRAAGGPQIAVAVVIQLAMQALRITPSTSLTSGALVTKQRTMALSF